MPIQIIEISQAECDKILAIREGHFCDVKAVAIKPAKLTRAIAALSNAEGGELYVGIEENKTTRDNTWVGFNVPSAIKSAGHAPESVTFKSASRPCRQLTVDLVGALSDLDDVAVRIADVAADLAVLGDRRREELGSTTFP